MAAVLVRRLASRSTERAIASRPLTSTAAAAASSPNEKDGGSSISSSKNNDNHRTHLLFGANTDVGKSIVSTGLVRAAIADVRASSSSLSSSLSVNYIKPLQCGGSDESFVLRHRDGDLGGGVKCRTLCSWDTPASPHLASRWEGRPVSDDEVLDSLRSSLDDIRREYGSYTIIETAGGAMSPSSSSPRNRNDGNDGGFWGWSTQADLYAPLGVPAVFVGDGRLGGISVTLSSLESLRSRGYRIDAVVFIEGSSDAAGVVDGAGDDGGIQFGRGNTDALREYIAMYGEDWRVSVPSDDSIVCLPPLPPMPRPLDEWYDNNRGAFLKLHRSLCNNK